MDEWEQWLQQSRSQRSGALHLASSICYFPLCCYCCCCDNVSVCVSYHNQKCSQSVSQWVSFQRNRVTVTEGKVERERGRTDGRNCSSSRDCWTDSSVFFLPPASLRYCTFEIQFVVSTKLPRRDICRPPLNDFKHKKKEKGRGLTGVAGVGRSVGWALHRGQQHLIILQMKLKKAKRISF